MEELSEAAKQMAFTDDLEKTVEERLNMFYHFVKVEYFIFLCYIWILDIFTTRWNKGLTGRCNLFIEKTRLKPHPSAMRE